MVEIDNTLIVIKEKVESNKIIGIKIDPNVSINVDKGEAYVIVHYLYEGEKSTSKSVKLEGDEYSDIAISINAIQQIILNKLSLEKKA